MGSESGSREVSAAAVLAQARALAAASPGRMALAVVLLAALGMAVELGADPDRIDVNLLLFAAYVVFQHDVTWTALASQGLVRRGFRISRVAGVLGVYLLTAIGIALGFVLLVVPGIILTVRWAIAVPILIGEDRGVIDSIDRSWFDTKGHFWAILGTMLVVYVPMILGIVIAEMVADTELGPFAPALIANFASASASVFWWLAAVAIYQHAAPRDGALADVFA